MSSKTAKKPARKSHRQILRLAKAEKFKAKKVQGVKEEPVLDQPKPLPQSDQMDLNWSSSFGHEPVLLKETIEVLTINPVGFYIDATLGGGGHSRAILEKLGPRGSLLALDADSEPIKWAEAWSRGDTRLHLVRANFSGLKGLLEQRGFPQADGLMADLGLNSRQLWDQERGFSFAKDGPLDMRLDPEGELTASIIVNSYPEEELAKILWEYGEERASRKLARELAERRKQKPFERTSQLAEACTEILGNPKGRPSRIHPATKLFMALRIAVNGELKNLESFLAQARSTLKIGGRLAVISFHSLEDRMVKQALRGQSTEGETDDPVKWKPWPRKAIKPGEAELIYNPRARSARLRAAEAL
jgi:16S rRNA (cytosine1402-N4)-methyltransferase